MRKGKLNWNTFCDREKEKVHFGFYSSQFSRFLECNQQGHKAERKVYTTPLRIFPSFKLWTHCFEDSMQRCFLAAPPALPLKPVIRFHAGWIQSNQVSSDFAQFFCDKKLFDVREQIHPPVAIIFPQSLPSTTRWEALVTISYIIGNWDGSLVRYHQIHRTFPNTFTLRPSNSGTSLLVFGKNRGLRPQNPPCLLGIAMRSSFPSQTVLVCFL